MKTYKAFFVMRIFIAFAFVLNACDNGEEPIDSSNGMTSVSFRVCESLEESTAKKLAEPQSFEKQLGNGIVLHGKIFDEGTIAGSRTKTTSVISDGTVVYAVICNSSNVVYDVSVLSVSSGVLTISVPSGVASIVYFYIGASCPSVSIGETLSLTSSPISETTDDDPMMCSATITAALSTSAGDNLGTFTFHHYLSKVCMKMYVGAGTRAVSSFTASLQDISCATSESVYPFTDPSTTAAAYTTTGTAADITLTGATDESDSLVSNTASFFTKVNSTISQTAVLDFSEASISDGTSLSFTQDVNDTLHLTHAFQASHKYKIVIRVSTVIPEELTLDASNYIITSVYDEDYLPYTAPTEAATTVSDAADGTSESSVVDVQGSLSTTGVTVQIPVTATGSGTLSAYSMTENVASSLTQDGYSRDVTLSWEDQDFTSSTTYITATLQSVDDVLNTKKLDINTGIGSDYLGVLLTSFDVPSNCDGDLVAFDLRDIACIPDKMCDEFDNGNTSTYEHQFFYVPVVAEDGNVWLNNNLGADYANLNESCFSPGQQATAYDDYQAYGSLFQWGRSPDGHELITWSSSSSGTSFYGSTFTCADTPSDALFIRVFGSPEDWRVNQDDDLWASESSTNNPCPEGFRVPTIDEYSSLTDAASITNNTTAASSALAFPSAGELSCGNALFCYTGSYGMYWSCTADDVDVYNLLFLDSSIINARYYRSSATSVRCIED